MTGWLVWMLGFFSIVGWNCIFYLKPLDQNNIIYGKAAKWFTLATWSEIQNFQLGCIHFWNDESLENFVGAMLEEQIWVNGIFQDVWLLGLLLAMSWAHLGWQEIHGLQELRETGTCTTRIVLLAGQLGRETTSSPYFGPIILGVGALEFSISCLAMVLYV